MDVASTQSAIKPAGRYSQTASRSKFVLFALLATYILVSAILFPLFRYHLLPDSIAYIDIGLKYLHGDWPHAVNSFWGPLLSWLLVPFLALPLPPLIATKVAF